MAWKGSGRFSLIVTLAQVGVLAGTALVGGSCGDASHSVLATATGHSSAHQIVRFAEDVDLELRLEREAAREPPPREARRRPAAMRATARSAPMRAATMRSTMRRGSGFVGTNPY